MITSFRLLLVLMLALSTTGFASRFDEVPAWKSYFDEFNVTGGFALYDLKNDSYSFYNRALFRTRFIPASTFKIPNSLIALETGVATDEHFLLKWDGVDRGSAGWNRDHDLESAFKASAVWYYQEMARRVGARRMQQWVSRLGYGNRSIKGGIDKFWLTGKLAISPEEQIGFLRRLHAGTLPVSKRSMDILRRIMITEQTDSYTLRGKTGWANSGNVDTGWYVGYLETKENVYFFAIILPANAPGNPDFGRSRVEITKRILREKGVM